MKTVICQIWTESEQGWGQRPDGYSLHLNEAQRVAYVKQYNESLPEGRVPSVYVFADGNGYLVDVDDTAFKEIKNSELGRRFNGSPPKRV